MGYFTNIPIDNKNVETICKYVDENDKNNKSHRNGVCVAVQTECYDSAQKDAANQQETSSDELQKSNPLAVILDEEEG